MLYIVKFECTYFTMHTISDINNIKNIVELSNNKETRDDDQLFTWNIRFIEELQWNGLDIFIFAKYVECLLNITNGIWSRPIAFIQKPNILLFEFI